MNVLQNVCERKEGFFCSLLPKYQKNVSPFTIEHIYFVVMWYIRKFYDKYDYKKQIIPLLHGYILKCN